jgi:hypothetical protein
MQNQVDNINNSESSFVNGNYFQRKAEIVIPTILNIISDKSRTSFIDSRGKFVQTNSTISKDFKKRFFNIIVRRSVFIDGEEFLLLIEDNYIILSHPKWSLTGVGPNLLSAENDLRKKARIFIEGYDSIPLKELSNEAIKFRNYLFSIL